MRASPNIFWCTFIVIHHPLPGGWWIPIKVFHPPALLLLSVAESNRAPSGGSSPGPGEQAERSKVSSCHGQSQWGKSFPHRATGWLDHSTALLSRKSLCAHTRHTQCPTLLPKVGLGSKRLYVFYKYLLWFYRQTNQDQNHVSSLSHLLASRCSDHRDID